MRRSSEAHAAPIVVGATAVDVVIDSLDASLVVTVVVVDTVVTSASSSSLFLPQ